MNFSGNFENFRLSKDEKPTVLNEFQRRNIVRLDLSIRYILPLFLAHILIFWFNLKKENIIEYQWRLGIISSHMTMFIVFLVLGFLVYYLNKKKDYNSLYAKLIILITYYFALFMGGIISVIDQLVTSAITPYMLSCLLIPLFLVIHPIRSFLLYFFSLVSFLFIQPYTQLNPNLLLSNSVNAISSAVIGFALSIILWQVNLSKLRKDIIIERQNAELEEQNKKLIHNSYELEKAIQAKDKFFSIISHDLKSPFQGFIGLTEMMSREDGSVKSEEFPKFSKVMHESAETVYKLLENLLEWAQMQKGDIIFNPTYFYIAEPLHQIIVGVKERAAQKGITLINEISEEVKVYGDEKMISAVLRNLISNAVKFTRRGGSIIISNDILENNRVRITVEDSGIGIPANDLKRLFKIEEKVSSHGTDGEASTGLGLLLCKEFVAKNGGKIWAESEVGLGSKFFFTIPSNEYKFLLQEKNN